MKSVSWMERVRDRGFSQGCWEAEGCCVPAWVSGREKYIVFLLGMVRDREKHYSGLGELETEVTCAKLEMKGSKGMLWVWDCRRQK